MAPTSDERGFTIIEVLIAMVILTVALVSMAELMAVTLRLQMLGRNETASIRLAQSKIDQLVAVNFSNATVAVGGSLTSDAASYNDTPISGYNSAGTPVYNYKRRWLIAAINGETRVRTLTVRIIPDIADRRTTAPVELTTIIRDP